GRQLVCQRRGHRADHCRCACGRADRSPDRLSARPRRQCVAIRGPAVRAEVVVTRNRLLSIAGLLLLAVLTWGRIRLIDTLPDQGYFAKYTIVADQILAGHIPRDRLLDFSPLYLWFMVGLRAVGLGFHAIRILQIVMISAAVLLVAVAARRFGRIAMMAAPVLLLGSRAALV